MSSVVVVLPTYNEAENLERIFARIRRALPSADVLIVDDGSPDGTGRIAEQLSASDPHAAVIHRAKKEGLGAAYVHGFGVALERGYDVIVQMDADGSHRPEQLPELLAALQDADLVLGSRWIRGGSVHNWPLRRKALSVGGNLYVRLLLGIEVRDATGGFRAFRRSTLERLDLSSVRSTGYCFQVDLAWRTLRVGGRIAEVPIEFAEREHGTSKMSFAVARESLVRITGWGVRERLRQLRGLGRR